jgi:hypothetical protein
MYNVYGLNFALDRQTSDFLANALCVREKHREKNHTTI